jgi:hypothetical protein
MATVMSAAMLLGGPVEIYAYGTMYLYWSEVFFNLYFLMDFIFYSCRLVSWHLFYSTFIYSNLSRTRKFEYICSM